MKLGRATSLKITYVCTSEVSMYVHTYGDTYRIRGNFRGM